MKFKEVNRGLVLGLVLLIGVVFHVNWQNHQFKKDIPVINRTIEEYGQEVLKSSVGDPKGFKQRTTSAIQNTYTGKGKMPEMVFANKASILMDIDYLDIDTADGMLYDAEFKVVKVKAIKSGSGARVDVSYEMSLTYVGKPYYIGIAGLDSIPRHGSADDNKKRLLKQEGSMNLAMTKEGDSWKILYVENDFVYAQNEELADGITSDDNKEVSADD